MGHIFSTPSSRSVDATLDDTPLYDDNPPTHLSEVLPAVLATNTHCTDLRSVGKSVTNQHTRKERKSDAEDVDMSTVGGRIVAAIRKTGRENREMMKDLPPFTPLGAPPALKRPRDEADVGERASKLPRSARIQQHGVVSTRVHNRVKKRVSSNDLSSRAVDTKGKILTLQPTDDSDGSLRADSESEIAGCGCKSSVGTVRPDKTISKARRCSLPSAAIAAIKQAVDEYLKEKQGACLTFVSGQVPICISPKIQKTSPSKATRSDYRSISTASVSGNRWLGPPYYSYQMGFYSSRYDAHYD